MGRITVKNRFATVPNELLNDCRISLKAKGLYAYMQSKDDGWIFSADRIASQCKEGRESILAAMKELIEAGWLEREQSIGNHGYFGNCDYILHAQPVVGKADCGESVVGKSVVGLSDVGKADCISKKEYSKKEYSKKEKNSGGKKKSEIQLETAPIISKHTKPPLITMFEHWRRVFPNYLESQNDDMPALRKICHFFTKREPIHVDAAELDTMMQNFTEIIRRHNFYSSRSLKTIANNLQSIMMDETNRKAQEQQEEKLKRLVLNDGQVNGYNESKGVKIRI